ncbi:hypothetical protein F441_18068 [Phytophthora nicotianae CJ01A1]|uniref:Uncharacterized protein n=1 Tax=Phytophthora nicotianae CJ01A1 TaxID=1317063 RepID=W2W3Z9_PHYNI|nr:hypothetical protein F441_18068 [Phytophthora nicotianae CJ01A1]
MEVYLEEDCTLTLSQLADKVFERFGVKLSTSTKRVVVKTSRSKGKNLQIQCAGAVEDSLVLHQLQRGSVRMGVNAGFVQ